jgi:hypothetical protein
MAEELSMQKTEFSQPWFDDIIIDGISQLLTLSLEFAPALELAPLTVKTWQKTIWNQKINWEPEADAWRIEKAFVLLAGRSERFPTPNALILALEKRKTKILLNAPVDVSKEQRAIAANELRRFTEQKLGLRLNSNSPTSTRAV